jgi:hypothetical protein
VSIGHLPRKLYFIVDEPREYVKIGISRDPTARLHSLQAGCPIALELEMVLEFNNAGAEQLEDALHQHFAEHWLHREWFRYAPAIKAYVAAWYGGESPDVPTPAHHCKQAYGPHGEPLSKYEWLARLRERAAP